MNKFIKKLIDKSIEKKMTRIEKELNSMSNEEFQKGVEEVLKILGKNLEKIESK
jgi:hypothetical protein